MTVQNTNTFLITLSELKLRRLLTDLGQSKIKFEVLNPKELGKKWQDIYFIEQEIDQKIKVNTDLIAKILSYYNFVPSSSFTDNRPMVTYEDIREAGIKEKKLLDIASSIDKLNSLQKLDQGIKYVLDNSDNYNFFVVVDSAGVKDSFWDFCQKASDNFTDIDFSSEIEKIQVQNINGTELIGFPETLEVVLESYKESETIKYLPLTDFYTQVTQQIQDINEYLLSREFDLTKPKDSLLELAKLHGYYEFQLRFSWITKHFFKLKPDSETYFAFINFTSKDQSTFVDILERNEIPHKPVSWQEEIVNWESNGVSSAFQNVAQSLGTISSKDADPNFWVSVFFSLFFALCLADVVYGLVLVGICSYFLFFSRVKKSAENFLRLFFYSGIVTIVIGILLNSWAGDLLNYIVLGDIPKSFQLIDLLNPQALTPVNQFLLKNGGLSPIVAMLGFSALLGMVHSYVAYLLGVKNSLLSKDYSQLSEQLSWLFFQTSVILAIVFTFTLPSLIIIGQSLIATSVLCLFVFNSAKGLAKIGAGLGKLYGLVSVFADMISYTRLVAVGLTGGIIAQVVNTLAFLFVGESPTIIGILLAVIIIFVGHSFNLVVSVFGAYINPLRLHYVEFFPKFYTARSRQLKPEKIEFSYVDVN